MTNTDIVTSIDQRLTEAKAEIAQLNASFNLRVEAVQAVDRMIGDQQPWALKKYAFADFTPYKADSPLLPSGLLGPVHLISVAEAAGAK